MNISWCKVDVNVSVSVTIIRTWIWNSSHIDGCLLRWHLTWMIPNDLYIWKLICCVFLNKREVLSRFLEKSNIFKYFSTCQTRSDDFWILNAMCMFMYLFVVYFSFAPVISASTHWYVNYFISKSWWWLINRNVNVDFTSWYIHLFGLYFFLQPSYIYI